ncbi:MAG: hypothetical protein D6798_17710 [Deltaproteobacteria bacterium]|nr:MAG: hypothetical protein D6798_17710 [Deltaproteobacteria bacterium]
MLMVLSVTGAVALAASEPPVAVRDLPAGRYALEIVLATRTRVPVLGAAEGRTTSAVLVEVEPLEGERTGPEAGASGLQRWWLTTCDVTVEGERGPGRVVVPDAFVSAHGTRPATAELLVGDDGLLAREQAPPGRWVEGSPIWRIDLGAQAVGWDPTLRSTVPRRDRDIGVVDWEGDGRPGGTIRLEEIPMFRSVEIHVAQVAHLRLWGTRPEEGDPGGHESPALVGRVEVLALEQRTLSASVPLFAASLRVEPDEAASSFRLMPLGPDADCPQVNTVLLNGEAK